jgi:uncharacterized protein (DUF885 family)
MLSRRNLLTTTAAAVASALPAARALAQATTPGGSRLTGLLDEFWREELRRHPEEATELGLDKGPDAGLKRRLTDVSTAGMQAERAANADRIHRLKQINRAALTGMDAVNYDTVLYVEEVTKPLLDLDVGGFDGFSPSPYVVSPITGAYQRIPVFLDTKHSIATREDADAYLARLDGFATVLDANSERLGHDLGLGIVPPDFLLDTTLGQMTALRVPASQSGLVQSLVRRAAAKGLGDYAPQATRIYEGRVLPALDRQIELVRQARARATHDAGVWRFRDGPAFYRYNLRYTTTTDMTPGEVHQMGLDQAKEIGARLDTLLKAQGLTQGTVGERIQALYKDPKQYFPNTPEGKAELLAYLQNRLAEVKRRLPRDFDRIPHFDIEARAVPAAIDAGAPLAYSESPAIDGSRPGYIYFNLHDTAEWPKWNLPSTLYHEGLPGHQLQGGLALESQGIPMLRRNMYFSGYGEGWALYAEQLADELGMYDDDPLGRIGWLKAQIFRAGRCVVDTGIHTMRWSRERAIEYLTALDGDAVGSTTREVDRYCAIPAQACSYKIGHTEWNRQRDKARAALGARFDIREFHDAGLLTGAMPLAVLDRAIDNYVRSKTA